MLPKLLPAAEHPCKNPIGSALLQTPACCSQEHASKMVEGKHRQCLFPAQKSEHHVPNAGIFTKYSWVPTITTLSAHTIFLQLHQYLMPRAMLIVIIPPEHALQICSLYADVKPGDCKYILAVLRERHHDQPPIKPDKAVSS